GIHSPEEKALQGFRIIGDAGYGAGGFLAEQVLQVLGADTTGSQFLEPDGHFPNHVPKPDKSEALKSIQTAVLANQADLGIIFDTEVDRSAVVD
ncbi:phosphomannomutase/phosphoglucomutase, partial [Enterococcus faecalis]